MKSSFIAAIPKGDGAVGQDAPSPALGGRDVAVTNSLRNSFVCQLVISLIRKPPGVAVVMKSRLSLVSHMANGEPRFAEAPSVEEMSVVAPVAVSVRMMRPDVKPVLLTVRMIEPSFQTMSAPIISPELTVGRGVGVTVFTTVLVAISIAYRVKSAS